MADETLTLKESIEKASEEQNVTPKEPRDPREEKADEDNGEAEEEKEEEFKTDPEVEEAINFYRALKDPAQQNGIIRELAARAGIVKPTDVLGKEEKKTLGSLIEEVLGEEYPDLKDKFGQIFKTFESEQNAKISAIRAELAEKEMQNQVQAFETEFRGFITENKVTEEMAAKMLKEMEDLPPTIGKDGKRISVTNYLNKIHRLAGGTGTIKVDDSVKRAEKINNNLKSRNTNMSSDVGEDRLKSGSKLPSLREAVNAAVKGIEFDND